jgi:ribosome-associated protein
MNELDTAKEMLEIVYKSLDDKKGEDIKVLDIRDLTVLADYFIIAHGTNVNHVKALIDAVEEALGKAGYKPKQVEGYTSGAWVLLDYGPIIIHIFGKEDRLFYDLERIWNDGKEINIDNLK